MSLAGGTRGVVDETGLVLSDAELARVRDQLGAHPWYRSIFEGFRSTVDELIARQPEIPVAKGRAFYESCPRDHTQLIFDPYAPHRHACPKCGAEWTGETFDLAWVRQFQGWHAKRLVESGIVYRIDGDETYARLVRDAFRHFTARYREYPLANNLLGPTRLFQSTFLEAFWLVDMVAAYDLTRVSPSYDMRDHDAIRRLLYESCRIVQGFDEGISNRQAFNNAGMGAVALLYRDDALLWHVLEGPHGFSFHMRESLLEDGIWYEGETYHFATLDHSLNLAEMARHRGIDLYEGGSGHGSLRPMFDGPLRVLLPDLTFPSRKDSWFGRGVGYHREVYELGYARYGDARFGGLLAHAYHTGHDRGDVGWRTFLYLEPDLPAVVPDQDGARPAGPGAVRIDDLRANTVEEMPGTGVAVLRNDDGHVYASLEYGHYGGGHGHPDRLHLSLFADGEHWLLDPGTGWYHVEELGWYRSTLAHNTVTLDGASQNPTEGTLTVFGAAGGLRVAQAVAPGAYPGSTLRRTLCLSDGFLLDAFDVDAEEEHTVDWTFHVRGDVEQDGAEARSVESLSRRGGHPFLKDLEKLDARAMDLTVHRGQGRLRVLQDSHDELYRATAMGIPLREDEPFTTFISRRRGHSVRYATTWTWGDRAIEATAGRERDDSPNVQIGDDAWRMIVDDEPGLCVVGTSSGTLTSVAWFDRERVDDHDVRVACDRRLDAASLRWHGRSLDVDLPTDFGRLRIRGSDLPDTSDVTGLPEGATWGWDGDSLVLQQRPGLTVWPPRGRHPSILPAGMDGTVRVAVARYGADPVADTADDLVASAFPDVPEGLGRPAVSVPDGWILRGVELIEESGPLSTWDVRVRPPASATQGELEVQFGDRHARLRMDAVAPLAIDWRVQSLGDVPGVTLIVRDASAAGGRVQGEVAAPWLSPAPHGFTLDLEPNGRSSTHLRLPDHPVPPVPLARDAETGSAMQSAPSAYRSEGEFDLEAMVAIDGFAASSRLRIPLTWCLPRSSATSPGRTEHDLRDPATEEWGRMWVGRSAQAYWAETPWAGPADASASAHLAWDEAALYLDCVVSDDHHVSDANDEDLYENDSVQIYLDFRPPERQDSTFAPGVAAFILAPDADLAGVRVQAIAGSRELANRGLAAPWFRAEGVEATVEPRPGGYRLAARMPYESLGIGPLRPGGVFRADLSLSDNDGSWYRNTQLVWSGARGDRRCYLRWGYLDPSQYGFVVVTPE